MKEYLIKKYDLQGNYIGTLSTKNILNKINYSGSINAGQGQLSISLNLPFTSTEFNLAKLLRVYCVDETHLDGRLIYSGVISQITRSFDNNKENLQIICLGLWNLLTTTYYKSGGALQFTKNLDPANILKDIIDYFNTKYTGNLITYTTGSIVLYGSNVNREFSSSKCANAITDMITGLSYYCYLGADGVLQFKPKPTTATHKFTYGRDIDKLSVKEDAEKVINDYSVNYTGGTINSSDSTSKTTFGSKELIEDKSDIQDNTSAQHYVDDYLASNKVSKKTTSLTINGRYDIETISPGDTVQIKNFDYTIDNLQITKVTYDSDTVQLSLEDFSTLAKSIFTS